MKPISRQAIAERRLLRRTHRRSIIRRRIMRRGEAVHAPGAEVGAGCEPGEVGRARSAGGPEDVAMYACSCGYCFDAAVSTTVCCPHCGTGQAW